MGEMTQTRKLRNEANARGKGERGKFCETNPTCMVGRYQIPHLRWRSQAPLRLCASAVNSTKRSQVETSTRNSGHSRITKRSHALGEPVRIFWFKVQRRRSLRNEPNPLHLLIFIHLQAGKLPRPVSVLPNEPIRSARQFGVQRSKVQSHRKLRNEPTAPHGRVWNPAFSFRRPRRDGQE